MKLIDLFISSRLNEKGVNLTRKQVIVMKILMHKGPLPQQSLAFITDRDKTSLTRILSGMERKNLVARIPSTEDKRVNLVHLTKNGEKVLNESMPLLLSIINDLQEGVSKKEKEAVIAVMEKIQKNIQKHSDSCNSNQ